MSSLETLVAASSAGAKSKSAAVELEAELWRAAMVGAAAAGRLDILDAAACALRLAVPRCRGV